MKISDLMPVMPWLFLTAIYTTNSDAQYSFQIQLLRTLPVAPTLHCEYDTKSPRSRLVAASAMYSYIDVQALLNKMIWFISRWIHWPYA
jgi:hypothetical protein